jgi:hypothetical protein
MGLAGKWRIIEMELWDRDFIDLVGRGFIRPFEGSGRAKTKRNARARRKA